MRRYVEQTLGRNIMFYRNRHALRKQSCGMDVCSLSFIGPFTGDYYVPLRDPTWRPIIENNTAEYRATSREDAVLVPFRQWFKLLMTRTTRLLKFFSIPLAILIKMGISTSFFLEMTPGLSSTFPQLQYDQLSLFQNVV